MTPQQLRDLRESRGLSREAFADFLGDCTASTVNKWERGMHAIPQWVEDKCLGHVELAFELAELHALMDMAREQDITFPKMLAQAVREYIARHHTAPNVLPMPAPQSTTGLRVAEDAHDPSQGGTLVPIDVPMSAEDIALVKAGRKARRAAEALKDIR